MSETKEFSSLEDVHYLINKAVEEISKIKSLLHTLKNSQLYCDYTIASLNLDDFVSTDEGEITAIGQADKNLNIFCNEALDFTTKLKNLFSNDLLIEHYNKILTMLEIPSSLVGVYVKAIKGDITSLSKSDLKEVYGINEMLKSQIETAKIIIGQIDSLWVDIDIQIDEIKSFLYGKEEFKLETNWSHSPPKSKSGDQFKKPLHGVFK